MDGEAIASHSIKIGLQNRLQEVIRLQSHRIGKVGFVVSAAEISLLPLDSKTQFGYVCAIALRLAPLWELSPVEVARQLIEGWQELGVEDVQVRAIAGGRIELRLSDRAVATQLHSVALSGHQIHPLWQEDRTVQCLQVSPDSSFLWQYAHARCCSLLQLSQRTCLYQNPIPWLTSEGQLQFQHPAERALIRRILVTVDELCFPPAKDRAEKLVQGLAQDFLSFERDCRIWGEVKTHTPQLAIARLGLVQVTQSILSLLLEQVLGIFAPTEL